MKSSSQFLFPFGKGDNGIDQESADSADADESCLWIALQLSNFGSRPNRFISSAARLLPRRSPPTILITPTRTHRLSSRVGACLAALQKRTIATAGALILANRLTKTLYQNVKLGQFGSAPLRRRGHHRVIDGQRIGCIPDEAVPAQHSQDMGVLDEGRHVQRAEIQRSGRNLAANAWQALKPCERFVDAEAAEEIQVEIRLPGAYDAKRTAQMPCLRIGKSNIAYQVFDIAGRCCCKSGPLRVCFHEPLIGGKRDFIECAVADR